METRKKVQFFKVKWADIAPAGSTWEPATHFMRHPAKQALPVFRQKRDADQAATDVARASSIDSIVIELTCSFCMYCLHLCLCVVVVLDLVGHQILYHDNTSNALHMFCFSSTAHCPMIVEDPQPLVNDVLASSRWHATLYSIIATGRLPWHHTSRPWGLDSMRAKKIVWDVRFD